MTDLRHLLVLDDEDEIREMFELYFNAVGDAISCTAVKTIQDALPLINPESNQVIITDHNLQGSLDGFDFHDLIAQKDSDIPVIYITGFGTPKMVKKAWQDKKAFDYFDKPVEMNNLLASVRKAFDQREKTLARRARVASVAAPLPRASKPPSRIPTVTWEITPVSKPLPKHTFLGSSPKTRRLLEEIDKAARKTNTVLLIGPTGSGKEVTAHLLHSKSPRANKPLITVNCGAIPESLFESELFGHTKGSFTGAVSDKLGKFEAADGGTIFLDEIGELPLSMQVKLLRVIQDGTFDRVGGVRSRTVNVRLIAATNRDLKREIKEGRFREDLFYRLNVIPITISPLRDRPKDLRDLFTYIAGHTLHKNRCPARTLPAAEVAVLERHTWPGNVRELESIATAWAESDVSPPVAELIARFSHSPNAIEAPGRAVLSRDVLVRALQHHGGYVKKVAGELGYSERHIRNKLKELGVDWKPFRK